MDIFLKITQFMNYVGGWFDENIRANASGIIKAILGLIVAVFYFFIEILKWIIGKL
ncbi:hypothetical protein HY227_01325 [Candidatus Wolfebacteria bacterium]|nr:hypothetical protein [Candidatus Wolfebacteria bacterium]